MKTEDVTPIVAMSVPLAGGILAVLMIAFLLMRLKASPDGSGQQVEISKQVGVWDASPSASAADALLMWTGCRSCLSGRSEQQYRKVTGFPVSCHFPCAGWALFLFIRPLSSFKLECVACRGWMAGTTALLRLP